MKGERKDGENGKIKVRKETLTRYDLLYMYVYLNNSTCGQRDGSYLYYVNWVVVSSVPDGGVDLIWILPYTFGLTF